MSEFAGKTILVTGGTGSFGRAVVNRLIETDVAEIRVFSRDELKQDIMRHDLNNPRVSFHLGDVRDIDSVNKVMGGVDLIFHAAALKQVPSCEFFPMQAVMTNVQGSNNVISSAIAHGVKNVVCLSTDKAVYPINAMGMTKALMEKVALAAARMAKDTVVSCVRYGNVMYSRGSVIPLFVKLIKQNKPLPVTVPEMTRFLMPLRDSVALVLFALQNSEPGDLFVKKAAACTVADLATALKIIFDSDVPTVIIGMRHGEKIHETLLTREELLKAQDMGDYYRVRMDGRDLNYSKYLEEGEPKESLIEDYTSLNTRQLGVQEIVELLLSLPEVVADIHSPADQVGPVW